MNSNSEIVRQFLDAWQHRDVGRIMDFFTDDAVWDNIPMPPPNRGKEAVRKAVEGFVGMSTAIEFNVLNQLEGPGGLVMNERADRFRIGDRWLDIPTAGVFELRDGKICTWRDYFDMSSFQK